MTTSACAVGFAELYAERISERRSAMARKLADEPQNLVPLGPAICAFTPVAVMSRTFGDTVYRTPPTAVAFFSSTAPSRTGRARLRLFMPVPSASTAAAGKFVL